MIKSFFYIKRANPEGCPSPLSHLCIFPGSFLEEGSNETLSVLEKDTKSSIPYEGLSKAHGIVFFINGGPFPKGLDFRCPPLFLPFFLRRRFFSKWQKLPPFVGTYTLSCMSLPPSFERCPVSPPLMKVGKRLPHRGRTLFSHPSPPGLTRARLFFPFPLSGAELLRRAK